MPFFGANPSDGSCGTGRDTNISPQVQHPTLWRAVCDEVTGRDPRTS